MFLDVASGESVLTHFDHMERTGSRAFSIMTTKQGDLFAKWVMKSTHEPSKYWFHFFAYGKLKKNSAVT